MAALWPAESLDACLRNFFAGFTMNEVLDNGLLGSIASMPVPLDLLQRLQTQLQQRLPQTADPAAVASRLQRFIAASRSPTSLLAFFERDEDALATLLRLLGTGNRLANQLIADPESFDLVRASGGADVRREVLIDEIVAELDALAACGGGSAAAAALLRSVAARERLRIAYGEFVGGASSSRVMSQLTVLAEAIFASAMHFASAQMSGRFGVPRRPNGEPGRLSVIGLGAFGAGELGYDTPLEVMFLCDLCGPTDGAVNLPGDEYFRRLCQQVVALVRGDRTAATEADVEPPLGLSAGLELQPSAAPPVDAAADVLAEGAPPAELGPLFAVSLARRPLGEDGPVVITVTEAHRHYQLAGRTWERVLHVTSRVVAGDRPLGRSFLELIEPWVYRKYLQRVDQQGLQTLLRKFARRLSDEPEANADIRHRAGGLNDIEQIVSLLQVINGGELDGVRVRTTAEAIQALLVAECLTVQEAALLSEHYQFLKRYEHCRQVDAGGDFGQLQAVQADDARSAAVTAWNLGYRDAAGRGDADQLLQAVEVACRLNQQTIRRLLEDADKGSESEGAETPIETELVLDPEPDRSLIAEVFSRHGMGDLEAAMSDLQRLADEPVPFLSSRRCRHHLAEIAPALLSEVGQTPEPHHTLRTLAQVSDSLGGKAVLWELFGSSPAALRLFVRLCACSPYLTKILVDYPGMIDELIDSLILDRLPSDAWLEASSTELCRTASDIRTILQSFKNGAHLQIGVRDCLGKESLEATHAALAGTAECILRRMSEAVQRGLAEQYGDPITPDGEPVELVMLALGKLGAKEPNYHSDLQVLFLYTADCQTQRRVGGHRQTTTTATFFGEVARHTTALINEATEGKRLLELGTPFDAAGAGSERRHAISVDALAGYFRRGQASLAQRLALCKARAISGSVQNRTRIEALIRELIVAGEWYPMMATQIQSLRLAMEASADKDNLKRAAGGTVDVEMITQALQLCHAAKQPQILVPGTMEALARIADADLIERGIAETLRTNYRTLREVESKLRLLDTPQRHEIPTDPLALRQLAFLMGRRDADEIVSLCRQVRASNRQIFNDLIRDLL